MGLFNKKNKSSDAAPDMQMDAQQPKKKKGKKRKDTMASILNESVTESALEAFRANTAMQVEHDGETVYVGMLLDANDPSIGGINKKSRRDEAKGQVIELINSGRINTYIPADYLEDEKLIIIPDVVTLDAMDEFTLLTEANYKLAFVHDDGFVEATEYPITYAGIMDTVINGADINDYLVSVGVTDMGSDSGYDDVNDITQPFSPVASDDEYDYGDGDDEIVPEDEDAPFGAEPDEAPYYGDDAPTVEPAAGEDVPDFDEPEPAVEPDASDIDEPEDFDAPAEEDAPVEDDDPQAEVEDEVSDEAMTAAITRKFYSDELGLEVTTEPFDAQFLHANTYVPFEENRGEGWLNRYLDEMSRGANLEMQHLHQTNLFDMREMYYNLISRHAEQIQHDLDETDNTTQYGALMDALDQKRIERQDGIAAIVAERRRIVDEEWDKALEQVGEDAMRAAQQQYRERYGKQHDERVFRIEPTVKQEVEDEYQDAVRKMRDERRMDAAKRMDYGITETLAEVSEEYMKRLADERKHYDEHRQRIMAFLDEHRKDDIMHDKVAAEELAQSEKADRVMAEYEQKLRTRAAEFNAERDALKSDIEATERRTAERIKAIQGDYDRRVAELRNENANLKGQLDGLIKQYADLDERKAREYGARLAEAKDEAKAWSSKCDSMMAVQRKGHIVSITAIVVAIIAALSIGVLVGTNMSLDMGSSKASTTIEQEFNKRMDQLESKQQELNDQTDQSKGGKADTSAQTTQQVPEQAPVEAPVDGAAAQN